MLLLRHIVPLFHLSALHNTTSCTYGQKGALLNLASPMGAFLHSTGTAPNSTLPPLLKSPPPRATVSWGGGGPQMTVSWGGAGGLQGSFEAKCGVLKSYKQTWVVGHPRQEWETGDVLGGWGSSTSLPKVWLIWTLSHPWSYGVVFRMCVHFGF